MIVNCDARALEVYCGAYLSRDKVMMQELIDGIDMHSANMKAFNLPSRLIAKVFKFRLMYGGQAYSYARDPDFTGVSTSEKYWQKVIDAYYEKYKGFAEWHNKIVQEVTTTGQLVMPTGRIYTFDRTNRGDWPITQIKNYPVQGLGADIMAVARVSFNRRFKDSGIKGVQVNTVHDSIVVDVEKKEVERTAEMFQSVFNDLPTNFERVFKKKFTLPLRCEVSIGNNMKELEEIKL